jgi:hypothetical protein
MGCLGLTFSYRPMQCSNMLHKCEEIQKKFTETFRKLSGIFTETFRKFSSLFILHSVSHMHRTPMGYLGLTFSYMQCSNMLHKCEEIQKKFTEIFRNLSGNIPEIFITNCITSYSYLCPVNEILSCDPTCCHTCTCEGDVFSNVTYFYE